MKQKLLFLTCFLTLLLNSAISDNVFSGEKKSGPDDAIPLKTSWKYNLSNDKTITKLVYTENFILFATEEGIMKGLDIKTGKIKWEFKAEGAIYEQPAVANGVAFVCSYSGFVYAINIATGKEKWRYEVAPDLRCTPVIFEKQVIIIYKKSMISLDIETGLELQKQNCLNINYLDYNSRDSIIYFTDKLDIEAINIGNCATAWKYSQKLFGISNIEIAFNYAYYCNLEGIFAINLNSGKLKWKFGFDPKTPPTGYGKILVNDSFLYVPIESTLYVFNAVTGKIKWGYKNKSKKTINTLAVDNNRTYFTDTGNIIYVMNNLNTKKIENKYITETIPNSQLCVRNNSAYYLTGDGFICAVKFP